MFEEVQYPVGKISEDEFITYKLYLKAERIAFFAKSLYIYAMREESITHSQEFFDLLEKPLRIMEEKIAMLTMRGYSTEVQKRNYMEALEWTIQQALEKGHIALYKELKLKRDILK